MKRIQVASVDELTPELIKDYRTKNKLSQRDFWVSVCCTGSRGHNYEVKKTPIPEETKRLIYLHYVVGVPMDLKSEAFAQFAKTVRQVSKA